MFSPHAFSALKGRKLHLGVCGSVAAYKAVELMRMLQKLGVSVSVRRSRLALERVATARITCAQSRGLMSASTTITSLV